MTLWLLVPLFALAQASCYDYEYYDPATGSSLPGNACAKAGASTAGQPVAAPATTFSGSVATAPVVGATTFSAPAATTFSAAPIASASLATAPVYGASIAAAPVATASVYGAPIATAPVYGTPVAAAPIYGTASIYSTPVAAAPVYGTPVAAAPVYGTPVVAASVYSAPIAATPVYGTPVATAPVVARTVAAPVYGTTTVSVPAAVTVSAGAAAPKVAANGQTQLTQQQIAYYKRVGEEQQRDHKTNQRIVKKANQALSRSSLVNTIVAGSGKIAPWYPMYRLGQQKKISNAFQDEVRIANRNADDAYDRFKQNPTRLNMLVSKYQDLNADLREAAAHYNNVNTGTFGQRLTGTGLFGTGSSLVNIISQTVVQRQEVEDLQDMQDDMNRVARQIQGEVKRLQGGSATASASANQQQGAGSVQQRMMAMSVYGPRG